MGSLWGIIPAAGSGTRIQPLAFSKELLPVGSFRNEEIERPRAISEYIIERMIMAGVNKICIVISPGKMDIIRYYGQGQGNAHFCYTVQQNPSGLCDALFCALPLIGIDDYVIIGLPDTVWFPENCLCALGNCPLSFLLFPVEHPELYDAVTMDNSGFIKKIHVKQKNCQEKWIWGAVKMSGSVLQYLYELWKRRNCKDEYLGTLINEYIESGGIAYGAKAGKAYVDVGTINGYREALIMLSESTPVYNS